MACTFDMHLVVALVTNTGLLVRSGKMEDAFRSGDGFATDTRVCHIALQEMRRRGQILTCALQRTGQNADRVPVIGKVANQMPADKASTTRDQDMGHSADSL